MALNREYVKDKTASFFADLERLCPKFISTFDAMANNIDPEHAWYTLSNLLNQYVDTCDFACGATKGVIIFDNEKFVLKVPFLENRYTYTANYCAIEAHNYDLALALNLEDCFAETFLVCHYRGIPIYAQEFAYCDADELADTACSAAMNNSFNSCNYTSSDFFNQDVEDQTNELVLQQLGTELAWKFFTFCEVNNINDRHFGNFGFINHHLVCIDFSGFGSEVAQKVNEEWCVSGIYC